MAGGRPDSASALAPSLPEPLTVHRELHGPAFLTPLTLSVPAGQALTIPTLPIKGRYTLENIRLVGGGGISNDQFPMANGGARNAQCPPTNDQCGNGEVLLGASPTTVVIEAIGDVLITSVQPRPLSLQEIRERGIVLLASDLPVGG
jgi:hypothetical protein